jgi:hypothetical protein
MVCVDEAAFSLKFNYLLDTSLDVYHSCSFTPCPPKGGSRKSPLGDLGVKKGE